MADGQAPLPLLLFTPNPINSILMTWDSFIFFAIPALLLWAVVLGRLGKASATDLSPHRCGTTRLLRLHPRAVDVAGAPAPSHDG